MVPRETFSEIKQIQSVQQGPQNSSDLNKDANRELETIDVFISEG